MKIGWATPYNIRSAIGKYSRMVCEELHARGHDVEIIRVEGGPELALAALDGALSIVDADTCAVDDYDVLVVNFGNHAPYHTRVVSLVAKRAPLGIFHDMEMRDFEWGMIHRHQVRVPRLVGDVAEIAARPWTDMVDDEARPLLASLAAMTCGAVIHGPHYHETVADYCPGPVEVIALCFPDTGSARIARPLSPGQRVSIFGMLNDYKQPRRVLEALALLRPTIGPVELHLTGAAEDDWRDALIDHARELGLEAPIFHGYASDEELQGTLENSHVVCCLRFPVTEGGSASLVTALFRARPLIISDVASYSMVPGDLAYKVSYGDDPDDVAAALRTIFADPEVADARALKARDWASDRFSAKTYVDALEPLLAAIGPHDILARTARHLATPVTTPGHAPMMVAIDAFAEVLDWMQGAQAGD